MQYVPSPDFRTIFQSGRQSILTGVMLYKQKSIGSEIIIRNIMYLQCTNVPDAVALVHRVQQGLLVIKIG
jgi:hypothetical protein